MSNKKIYKGLIDKSIGSMLSAIEIYNKPDFKYREETFAILVINSWEILFKARLLKLNAYKLNTIYCYKPYISKKGVKSSKKKVLDRNRTGNPKTISIHDAMLRLNSAKELPIQIINNIDALIELRDNAIHFVNSNSISNQVQELGFACIKNYINIFKIWHPRNNLSQYNLYLMPLAYVDSKRLVHAAITKEEQNFLTLVKDKIDSSEHSADFDIAIQIEVNFKKTKSFDGLAIQYDKDGVPITLTEEEVRTKFPLTHADICKKAPDRYTDFKQTPKFHGIMRTIKSDPKLCHNRKLDTANPKSISKNYFSTNVWQELEKHYTRK